MGRVAHLDRAAAHPPGRLSEPQKMPASAWNPSRPSALYASRPFSAPTWASACQTRFARVFLWARPRSHDRGLLRLAVIERIVNGGRSLHPGSVQRLPKLVVSNQPSPALPPRSTRGALLCQPSCPAPISTGPAASLVEKVGSRTVRAAPLVSRSWTRLSTSRVERPMRSSLTPDERTQSEPTPNSSGATKWTPVE